MMTKSVPWTTKSLQPTTYQTTINERHDYRKKRKFCDVFDNLVRQNDVIASNLTSLCFNLTIFVFQYKWF